MLSNRIFSNWKSSLLAICLILISFGLVALEKATLSEVGVFWGAAFVLLFSKDA